MEHQAGGFQIISMTGDHAQEIAAWHYEPPYDFYDLAADPDDLRDFLNPTAWTNKVFAVLDEAGQLIGFFELKPRGLDIEIGLGLRPDLAGQGHGQDFVSAGVAFAQNLFSPRQVLLAVATFNERAIKVYRRVGFEPVRTYVHRTNDGEYEFLEMVYTS